MEDLKSNQEPPVPDEREIQIIGRQSRDDMDASDSAQLGGNKGKSIRGKDESGTATDTEGMEEDTVEESWWHRVEAHRARIKKAFYEEIRLSKGQDPTPQAPVMNLLTPLVLRYPPRTVTDSSWAPGNEITFTNADLPPYLPSLNIPLYLTAELRGVRLSKVLVSNATPFNVMPRRTFDILRYNQSDLLPCSVETVDGTVRANLKLGMLDSEAHFVVKDVPALPSYNLLLGIPWLHDHRAIPSTLHHKVKLPFKMGNQDGILTIKGERWRRIVA